MQKICHKTWPKNLGIRNNMNLHGGEVYIRIYMTWQNLYWNVLTRQPYFNIWIMKVKIKKAVDLKWYIFSNITQYNKIILSKNYTYMCVCVQDGRNNECSYSLSFWRIYFFHFYVDNACLPFFFWSTVNGKRKIRAVLFNSVNDMHKNASELIVAFVLVGFFAGTNRIFFFFFNRKSTRL